MYTFPDNDDERGSPGTILTFFEFPGTPPGRAGAGMIHRLTWRVGDQASLVSGDAD